MKAKSNLSLAFALVACCGVYGPAQAGDPKTEANRCSRWLDAFFRGNIDQVAVIGAEQLRPGDVSEVYVAGQRTKLEKLFEFISKIGAGPPKSADKLNDAEISSTGDIIVNQKWTFPSSAQAYVGCVSYPGTDSPWHLVVKFEKDTDSVISALTHSAESRVASPPERSP